MRSPFLYRELISTTPRQQLATSPIQRTGSVKVCDDAFPTERDRQNHYKNYHSYCEDCERFFMNDNNLVQHMHSRTHMGDGIKCPFCKKSYTTASGVVIHLEAGSCSSGMNRQKINDAIRNLDRNNVITRPMITMPGYENTPNIATERAWNGRAYECYFCDREFGQLHSLNSHLRSPAHDQKMYNCPNRRCGKDLKLLSSLVAHFESESCGFMRFGQIQSQARNGINNMAGRMIGN